jgi:hypothetical protein
MHIHRITKFVGKSYVTVKTKKDKISPMAIGGVLAIRIACAGRSLPIGSQLGLG